MDVARRGDPESPKFHCPAHHELGQDVGGKLAGLIAPPVLPTDRSFRRSAEGIDDMVTDASLSIKVQPASFSVRKSVKLQDYLVTVRGLKHRTGLIFA